MEDHLHNYQTFGRLHKLKKVKNVASIITTEEQYKILGKGKETSKWPSMRRGYLYRCSECGQLIFIPPGVKDPPQFVSTEHLPDC